MKKFLIIASIFFISLGIVSFTLFLFTIDFNFRNLSGTNHSEYVIDDDVSAIEIRTATAEINLISSNVEQSKITFDDNDRERFYYEVVDGVLKIGYQDNTRWYQLFNWGNKYINVYLPEKTYESLTINNSTGDVTVNGITFSGDVNIDVSTADIHLVNASCANAKIDVSTGDVEINNLTALGDLSIVASTGDTDIDNSTANNLKINGSSSSIEINGLIVNDTIDLSTTTGSNSLENVKATSAKINTTTGDVELENFILSGELIIDVSTGDVEISNTDCASAKIKTTTGYVKGSFLTDKIYYTSSTSGKVRVPHSSSGGICEISTTSGDIFIGQGIEIDD